MQNLQKFFSASASLGRPGNATSEEIGKIVISKDTCTYRVDKLKNIIDIIIPHFDKYLPVRTHTKIRVADALISYLKKL